MRYIVIPPEGNTSELEVPEGQDLPREQLKQLVSGNIEHVNVLWNGQYVHAFVNDVGQYRDDLQWNPRATAIYHNNTQAKKGTGETVWHNREKWLEASKKYTYNDFKENPARHIRLDIPPIIGTMLLWPYPTFPGGNE